MTRAVSLVTSRKLTSIYVYTWCKYVDASPCVAPAIQVLSVTWTTTAARTSNSAKHSSAVSAAFKSPTPVTMQPAVCSCTALTRASTQCLNYAQDTELEGTHHLAFDMGDAVYHCCSTSLVPGRVLQPQLKSSLFFSRQTDKQQPLSKLITFARLLELGGQVAGPNSDGARHCMWQGWSHQQGKVCVQP